MAPDAVKLAGASLILGLLQINHPPVLEAGLPRWIGVAFVQQRVTSPNGDRVSSPSWTNSSGRSRRYPGSFPSIGSSPSIASSLTSHLLAALAALSFSGYLSSPREKRTAEIELRFSSLSCSQIAQSPSTGFPFHSRKRHRLLLTLPCKPDALRSTTIANCWTTCNARPSDAKAPLGIA